ncbi:hypothetical protein PSACC_01680 [Paramicrosporidium saccamoebae]|uniref:Uncharacterized protein n=1 Tax=Paramicrosporidium saccamoebae TaxID=1246581 RepID=A0A2H9TLC0_9FUNG|nr:hypothetical protein PSACC_01680 [Paramicrosporidium saccamoebae]
MIRGTYRDQIQRPKSNTNLKMLAAQYVEEERTKLDLMIRERRVLLEKELNESLQRLKKELPNGFLKLTLREFLQLETLTRNTIVDKERRMTRSMARHSQRETIVVEQKRQTIVTETNTVAQTPKFHPGLPETPAALRGNRKRNTATAKATTNSSNIFAEPRTTIRGSISSKRAAGLMSVELTDGKVLDVDITESPKWCAGQVEKMEWDGTVTELLLNYSGCVYTTLRTIDNGKRIVELAAHARRLDDALVSILQAALPDDPTCNYKITVIVTKNKILAIPEAMPPKPSFVQIEIKSLSRRTPTIKSTNWVADRQSVEQARRPESNEIVMLKGDELVEGLSSNLAVIRTIGDFIEIRTAPKGRVLAGTIMELVKQAVEGMNNVKLIEECPRMAKLSSYEAVFITSTSRLVMPVDCIILPDGSTINVKSSANPTLLCIGEAVEQLLASRSTSLY